jgi:mono/diheme cytochrome c family protein
MGRVILGILLTIVLVPVGVLGWLHYGNVPVAVADPLLPQERLLTGLPLHARIQRELVKTPPILVNEENLLAGAHLYKEQCAVCHGFHGKPSVIGGHIFPTAPALWEKHNDTVVGVSDDPPGETYWKVANGIRLTGMPAYKGILSENEIWQVSLLLANANKPLPPSAVELLRGDAPSASAETPEKK